MVEKSKLKTQIVSFLQERATGVPIRDLYRKFHIERDETRRQAYEELLNEKTVREDGFGIKGKPKIAILLSENRCEQIKKPDKKEKHHPHSATHTQDIWQALINPSDANVERAMVTGTTLKICDRWREYKNFLLDMSGAVEGVRLIRFDPKKPYSKENCRWVK